MAKKYMDPETFVKFVKMQIKHNDELEQKSVEEKDYHSADYYRTFKKANQAILAVFTIPESDRKTTE